MMVNPESKFVNVATVKFATKAERGAESSAGIVLAELNAVFAQLRGHALNLAVFSEGVEAFGHRLDTAEDVSTPGPFLQKYMSFAKAEQCHVAGSMKTARGGKVYNSIAFVDPKGDVLGVYDKCNLTQWELDWGLSPGEAAVVVDSAIGRLGVVVCFDLNFEGLRFQYRTLKPDILCFASMYHGGLMQAFWAYERRSFFAAALPIENSAILDPLGRVLAATTCYANVAKARLNLDRAVIHLDFNLDKFPEIERKYRDEVSIQIPPHLGPALLYSQSPKRTAMDIVEEFKLEMLDEYMTRSLKLNDEKRNAPCAS